ncbi:MAG: DUF6543 domain-containing protein, partial [Pseudomonas sp.]|uniref:dermonecrotic toxin domain-containing protein n=1 Tax=Pseudomonas sp. TaxID=306 RepID=UPI003C780B6D
MDGTAVVQLIRQLDIAKTYRALLTTHLTSDTDDTRERRALFCRQLPWQLLRHAHEEKLEERLSATAWGFVQHVIDMPDAVARALVSTATAVMRSLALVVTPGAQPVTVLGMYLISRAPPMSGPLVLYAPHSPLRVFTEFAGEAQLLDDINRPGPLQEWIIHQLDASHQATYRNLLRPSPPTGQADIRLATNPVRGNVLTRLFHDNALQLIKMLAGQFDLDGGHAWGSITQLLRKGAIGALHFIAGKLSYPWVVWRSFKLFLGSAEALQQQRFGEGLHAFALGLATLASLRNGLDESFAPEPDPAPPAQAFAANITDPARTRMRHFEAGTVALSDLQQSPQSYVYSQSASNRHYVPMAGKVFPVSRAGERWRVGLAPELGPFVERNALGQWVLDLSGHDPRFGPALSRYMERLETRRAERESINVEAAGMPAIRALSPARAECIDRALNVATYYTVTCLRNLTLFARQPDPNSRTALFLTEMFGVLNVSPEQVAKIITCVEAIIQGLTEYTLTHPHS